MPLPCSRCGDGIGQSIVAMWHGAPQNVHPGPHSLLVLKRSMFPNREVPTCRFHDICLNHTSLEWQYYVDPEDAEVPLFYHYLNGHAVYEFPGDFVMTGHVHILPYTPWAPKVMTVLSHAVSCCSCGSGYRTLTS